MVQGACIGGGVDMVSACDMRIATKDAYFQIKVSLTSLVVLTTLQATGVAVDSY